MFDLIKDKLFGHSYQLEGSYYRERENKKLWNIQRYKRYKCVYCGDVREVVETELTNIPWYEVDEIARELEKKGYQPEKGGKRSTVA